ncbi:acyl-CoA dehydrogenase family protein [Actinospica sp.]|uniref:acyl-CoA dehydrogenase family protein n=1 Tax=Actinospica sp. TaxID=1872142 RepID=UPI002C26626F|nr:acyl-CoA dehydrogenase family protein [Actinospica sp.]HWG24347.1 acyl-CoA dehydrogenase family protein [Actinospica sp.]
MSAAETERQSAPESVPESAWEPVLEELRRRRGEFRERRFVPRDFVDRLKQLGIYRAATPRAFGGEPLPPAEFLGRIERISVVDGSTGWVAGFGSAQVYLAALPIETQREIYADGPDVVFAGGLHPAQPASRTAKGFLVNGRWKYASGAMAADLLGVGIRSEDAGKPLTAVLRPAQVEILQEWNAVGMQGTGSFDLVVKGVEVDRAWTFIRGGEPTIDEPLYRYPTIAYAAQVLAVVGAGVARAALDYAIEVGAERTSITGAPKPADRAYYRVGVAEAEAALGSARAWFYELTHEAWRLVLSGEPVSDVHNARLRLAAAHLAKTAAQVVSKIVELSGSAALDLDHPLQQLHGDALVPQLHAFLGPAMYDSAGAVLMGLPPTAPAFR